jgi:hypothetical protein
LAVEEIVDRQPVPNARANPSWGLVTSRIYVALTIVENTPVITAGKLRCLRPSMAAIAPSREMAGVLAVAVDLSMNP